MSKKKNVGLLLDFNKLLSGIKPATKKLDILELDQLFEDKMAKKLVFDSIPLVVDEPRSCQMNYDVCHRCWKRPGINIGLAYPGCCEHCQLERALERLDREDAFNKEMRQKYVAKLKQLDEEEAKKIE